MTKKLTKKQQELKEFIQMAKKSNRKHDSRQPNGMKIDTNYLNL